MTKNTIIIEELQRSELIAYIIEGILNGELKKDNYNSVIVEYVNYNYNDYSVRNKSEIVGSIRNKIMHFLANDYNDIYKKLIL